MASGFGRDLSTYASLFWWTGSWTGDMLLVDSGVLVLRDLQSHIWVAYVAHMKLRCVPQVCAASLRKQASYQLEFVVKAVLDSSDSVIFLLDLRL
ncbi:hypothetical protein HAX54_049769 [Datura stramonium]|uniref:Uncharacterized protein n=1 Tax=Datura stramonium TaxID=4076 RepID=A0ABS8WKP8_DATST|nr:hypothetical protein [Datura stramonium]